MSKDKTSASRDRPAFHVSEVTGNRYPYDEYTNHGWGGVKYGFKDLPHDEYPYFLEYEFCKD
jgi:hypothetical protein